MSRVDPAAAARLAAAARRVIDRIRRSTAPAERMEEAVRALEAAGDALAGHLHPGPYMQRGIEWAGEFEPPDHPIDFTEFFPYSPLVGPRNPLSPPMELAVRGERLHGRVVFGAAYNGPPGSVHGGVIAAAFDELLGATNVSQGVGGMTGTLTVRYREPTPIDREIELQGWIERVDGKKVFTRGEMRHEGTLTAEAEGIFIGGSMDRLRAALGTVAAG